MQPRFALRPRAQTPSPPPRFRPPPACERLGRDATIVLRLYGTSFTAWLRSGDVPDVFRACEPGSHSCSFQSYTGKCTRRRVSPPIALERRVPMPGLDASRRSHARCPSQAYARPAGSAPITGSGKRQRIPRAEPTRTGWRVGSLRRQVPVWPIDSGRV